MPNGVSAVGFVSRQVRGVVAAIALLLCTHASAQCGPAWTLPNASGPEARESASLSFDTVRSRSLMFGGLTGSGPSARCFDDLWSWNGTRWDALASTGSRPIGRAGHVGVFDPLRDRLVVFGGLTLDDGPILANDTWEWDGSRWTMLAATGPAPRSHAAATFDPIRRRIVMFGGEDPSTGQEFFDTWLWDGVQWERSVYNGPMPGARRFGAMAFDAARGTVVLFGGMSEATPLSDTWLWNGSSWRLITALGPLPRINPSMAYDTGRQRVVLFGGQTETGRTADTWEWDGARWIAAPVFSPPAPRSAAAMCADSARGALVVFGGEISDFSQSSQVLELVWNGRPVVLRQPSVQGSCSRGSAEFSVFAVAPGGSAPLAYQWQVLHAGVWSDLADGPTGFGGVAWGADGSDLNLWSLGTGDAWPLATYRCVVRGVCDATISDATVVHVCAADFDDGSSRGLCDGGVTIDDMLYYVDLYHAGAARADMDDGSGTGRPDGGVTIEDLLYFFARFEAGC